MDVVNAVEKLSEHGYIRANRIIGNYYQIACPFHNDGNERRPSCGVLLHDESRNGTYYRAGWFHCFTCGYVGSFVEAVNKIFENRNMPVSGHDWLVENISDFEDEAEFDHLIPEDTMDQLLNKHALDHINYLAGTKKSEYVSEEELASYRFTIPYMYERKLTDQVIEAYDVGYDANWIPPGRKNPVPCITFPIRDRDGHTLYFCRRSVQGKLYNYPDGVVKSVFGIDMIEPGTRSVVICESCINALTSVTYGYPAVAVLGTGNSYQIQQLKELGVHEFVLCFDGDDAGRRATNKFKKALKNVAFVWSVTMPEGKDLNDLSKSEFDALYAQRS